MKKMKFQVAALSMLLVLGSCQTKTGTGAAIGAGSLVDCSTTVIVEQVPSWVLPLVLP